jgi:hypothetical protein
MSGRPGGWVPVEVEPEKSLFAPIEPGHPLVKIDGGDPTSPERTVAWLPALNGPSWYANFPPSATFLEVAPADEMFEPRTLDATGWFRLWSERADRSAGVVKFERPPESSRKLTAVHPADLAVRAAQVSGAMPGDAGADVKQLPTPTDAATGER